jgi:hypothetical protein
MGWPQPTDYNEAIQNPRLCFQDAELRQGEVVVNALGLPMPCSGNFAAVYKVLGADQRPWAVKCFTRQVEGLHERYQAISEHLRRVNLRFMVEFQYLDQGIRVGGSWYPVVKMHWIEGFTLNTFVKNHLDKPRLLTALAEQLWVRLAQQLRQSGIAHADLQHGNVLLVPGSDETKLRLRLIDYDGMFVPALAGSRSGEVGHASFQHPQRIREGTYSPEVDRFSHLVIYTALRCLAVGRQRLWDRYDNGDNLLFRKEDFETPGKSELFRELWRVRGPALRALVGLLILATQAPLEGVPLLEDFCGNGKRPELTAEQEEQIKALLAAGRTTGRPRQTQTVEDTVEAELVEEPIWDMVEEVPELEVPVMAEALEPAEDREWWRASPETLSLAPLPTAPAVVVPELIAIPPVPTGLRAVELVPIVHFQSFKLSGNGRPSDPSRDACAWNVDHGRVALASGVYGGHSPLWAQLLAEGFTDRPGREPGPWDDWLPPLQERWVTEVRTRTTVASTRRAVLEQGAFGTFLGLVLEQTSSSSGSERWHGIAVGNICSFQVRADRLQHVFPLRRSVEFEMTPWMIGTHTAVGEPLQQSTVRAIGEWQAGDRFWLMTDALGRWFLEQVESGNKPWVTLEHLFRGAQETLTAWVQYLRESRKLPRQDLALVAVSL